MKLHKFLNSVPSRRFKIGDSASLSKVFTSKTIDDYVALSGDSNPIHVNKGAAVAAGFRDRVVHGALHASSISNLLGNEIPGPGSVYVSQLLRFKAPVIAGDEVLTSITITGFKSRRQNVTFESPLPGGGTFVTLRTVSKVRDTVVLEGEAVGLTWNPCQLVGDDAEPGS